MEDAFLSSQAELTGLIQQVRALAATLPDESTRRWLDDVAAVQFHLHPPRDRAPALVILGGTGTGKSTLLNRMVGAQISQSSFRRTFTGGAVAAARDVNSIPLNWLGLPHMTTDQSALPVRGDSATLQVVSLDHTLLEHVTIVDTPDLDGDTPAHHAVADRAFRWAQAVLFVVTPEKYQMTELLPYYRLADRYGVMRFFLMNKCEEEACVADYQTQLQAHTPDARVKAIARDDSAYQPTSTLDDLVSQLKLLTADTVHAHPRGVARRVQDSLGRLKDQVIAPTRARQLRISRTIDALRSLETPQPGIDVNPITEQLQRRLQEQSVLYLMGPKRILDRLRQTPALLARLPRTTWDLFRGKQPSRHDDVAPTDVPGNALNFSATLSDQFRIVQSRINDTLAVTSGAPLLSDNDLTTMRIDPIDAGKIADEELADLKQWLQTRWNATPRDTVLLLRLLKHLPGGSKLTQWAEAAPYLLAIIVATHHAFFGHIDLLILGGYSLITWLTEHVSNEVSGRTKLANQRIAERFTRMVHDQLSRTIQALQRNAPPLTDLDHLDQLADDLHHTVDREAAGIPHTAPLRG